MSIITRFRLIIRNDMKRQTMLKTALSAAFAAASLAVLPDAAAQQGTIREGDRSFSASNWYISAQAGEQCLLKGSATGKFFVGKINAGTWFDTWSGLRINVQGGLKKIAGDNSVRYYSAGADYAFNLLRIFGGYDETAPFSFTFTAGPAYNLVYYRSGDNRYTHTVSLNLGAQIGYDFSPRWGIFAEAMSYTMERFYSPGFNVFTGIDCSLGIRFRFTRHRYGRRDQDRAACEQRMTQLDARVRELEDRVRELESLDEDEQVIIAPESVETSVDIYFDEFSSFLNDDQRRKIDGIGEWMASNPDFNVKIVVFSDNLSDAGTGARIMRSRAEVLESFLMEKYGIGRDRIESVSSEEVGYRNLTGCNAKIIFTRERLSE